MAVEAPANLTDAERALQDYYATVMTEGKVLTAGDRDALRLYVQALVQIDEIRAERPEGFRAELSQWTQTARLCASDLGLTPASRARVATTGSDDVAHETPLARLQGQARRLHVVQ